MTTISIALGKTARASHSLAELTEKDIDAVLRKAAVALWDGRAEILQANTRDVHAKQKSDPTLDRLRLTEERIKGICDSLRAVASLPSPLGRILDERTRPNGLRIKKVSVPLGVIGMIYEARPNVTVDAFALCFKAGNACVLKGGSDAEHSNKAIVSLLHTVLKKHGIDPSVLLLLPADRSAVKTMLTAHGLIDVLIPRGGGGLIKFVRENATIPVIETGAGVVHVYAHSSADVSTARKIVENGKTRRCTVCNALDCLIIDEKKLVELPEIVSPLKKKQVKIFADMKALKSLKGTYPQELLSPSKPSHYGTEFLSMKMAIKTVKNLDGALAHIAEHGSKHTEVIVAEDTAAIDTFTRQVDAAAVISNASPSFTDGGEFGMGAEIGISTQKLHTRGPMALPELTTVKRIVEGSGQVRL